MISKKVLMEDFKQLSNIQKIFDESGFDTELFPVEKDNPIPILTVAFKLKDKDNITAVNMAFTPFNEDELEENKILQLSITFDLYVNNENRSDLIQLCNMINIGIAMGHFTLNDHEIWYRYTYAFSRKNSDDYNAFLEIISLYSILSFEYEGLFTDLSLGKITLEDARKKALPF